MILRATRYETLHEVSRENDITTVVAVQFTTAAHRSQSDRWHAMLGGDGGILCVAGESPGDAKKRMVAALRKIADELEHAT